MRHCYRQPTITVFFSLALLLVFLSGCSASSKRNNNQRYQRPYTDYELLSQEPEAPPPWVMAKKGFLKKEGDDAFFVHHSGPKISQEIACNMVRAYARDEIADEMMAYLIELNRGEPWELTLVNKGPALVQDSLKDLLDKENIAGIYKEERLYPARYPEEDPLKAYTCSLLLKVKKSDLRKSLNPLTKVVGERHFQIPSLRQRTGKWFDQFWSSLPLKASR